MEISALEHRDIMNQNADFRRSVTALALAVMISLTIIIWNVLLSQTSFITRDLVGFEPHQVPWIAIVFPLAVALFFVSVIRLNRAVIERLDGARR